jgi:hypothetical protein
LREALEMKWLVMVTSNLGAAAGWWLGEPFGLMTAFILGMVGLGEGIWGGRRWGTHLGL